MRGQRFCYYQFNARREQHGTALTACDFPLLEDANSIQCAIMQIARALLAGAMDRKTAGLLLYALQTASSNLPRMVTEPSQSRLQHELYLAPRRRPRRAIPKQAIGELAPTGT